MRLPIGVFPRRSGFSRDNRVKMPDKTDDVPLCCGQSRLKPLLQGLQRLNMTKHLFQ
jgi:hypothetical protein